MHFIKTIRELMNIITLFEKISAPHLRSLGLTTGQFDVIATLGNQPAMSCKELAEKTLMLKGNLTVVLTSLLKKELISRTENPNDGRSTLIGLTAAGNELFKHAFPAHTKYLQLLHDQFDVAEMNQLRNELYAIRLKLEDYLNTNSIKRNSNV